MSNRMAVFMGAVSLLGLAWGCSPAVGPVKPVDPSLLVDQIEARLSQGYLEQAVHATDPLEITLEEGDRTLVKVPVAGDDPQLGDSFAPVTVVVYSDFQCPFCGRYAQTVHSVKEQYGTLVRVVFKQYPLPFHPRALPAAVASLAAHEQGKFWPVHDKLFDRSEMNEEELGQWAAGIGLDFEKVQEAIRSGRLEQRVRRDMTEGESLGVQGTPSSFINGVELVGAVPLSTLEAHIDLALARALVLLRQGVAPEQLYERLIGAKQQ